MLKRHSLFNYLGAAVFLLTSPVLFSAPLSSFQVIKTGLTQERLFDGIVEAVHQTTVSAQTVGKVIEINFDVDDSVEKGEVLLKISDSEQSASAAQAMGGVSSVQAQLTLARNDFNRFQQLFKSRTITRSQLDKARSALESARARLKTAKARKDNAQKQIEYTIVRAPYAGIVTKRFVELGETVAPGKPLMSGLSLSDLRITTNIPNDFAQKIKASEGVDVIFDALTKKRVHASKITVFPFANLKSNSVTVRINLPETLKGIYPGMLGKTVFKTGENQRILVPASAVIYRSEISGVYVLDGEHIYLRRISIGKSFNKDGQEQIEVLSGLKVGEQVASDPIAAVKRLLQNRETQQSSEGH